MSYQLHITVYTYDRENPTFENPTGVSCTVIGPFMTSQNANYQAEILNNRYAKLLGIDVIVTVIEDDNASEF